MAANVGAPVPASVIVLMIQEFARKAVTEQSRLKSQLEELVARAVQSLPAEQRIVLDAPHGVVLALLAAPRVALRLAETLEAGRGELPLCIGINHGPVMVAEDANREAVTGDGLTAGMTVTQAAAPGRIIASRSFQEALRADAPACAARLAPAGMHTDTQLRTHALYTPDRRAARSRRVRLLVVGATAFVGILGLGVMARMALYTAPWRTPAVLVFQIAPHGDVYINGVLKGQSPPLTRIEVAAGRHTVEVHNGAHPPLRVEVNPAAAEELTISHAFVPARRARPAKKPAPARQERRSEWERFVRDLGF